MSKMLTRRASALLVVSAIAVALMAASARAADVEVGIHNFTFAPQKTTVKAGTTVVWVNSDDIPHNVVSKTMVFKSNVIDTDEKFSFTFTKLGAYPYFCALHPHMTGTIVVE